MEREKHVILGVHISDRYHHVPGVQDLFTKYGCSIKTRLGLHEADEGYCSPNGLILLEMRGEEKISDELMNNLNAIEGIEVKKIVFDHSQEVNQPRKNM